MLAAARSRVIAVVFAAIGGVAGLHALRGSERPADAQALPQLAPATIAIVATPHAPEARLSEVRLVTVDAAGTRTATLARISHAPQAVVRGDVLRAMSGVVIAADDEAARDRDWGSTLMRVDANGAQLLLRGLYHASRPLASIDGYVYVERGASGAAPAKGDAGRGLLRVDALAIDAIDPVSGSARRVYNASGYTLHICGETERELIVYFVAPSGAQLLGVDRASGAARSIAALAPFARDFSIDRARGALVMSNRDASDSSMWAVESIDLATGSTTRLHAQRDEAPAPFVLDDGSVAWTGRDRQGLAVGARKLAPFGPGFDAVTATDGRWITIHHVVAGGFDTFAAVHAPSAVAQRLTSADERVEVLGFVGAANGGAR